MREEFLSSQKGNAQKPISLELVLLKIIQKKQQLFLEMILNQTFNFWLVKDQVQQVRNFLWYCKQQKLLNRIFSLDSDTKNSKNLQPQKC